MNGGTQWLGENSWDYVVSTMILFRNCPAFQISDLGVFFFYFTACLV